MGPHAAALPRPRSRAPLAVVHRELAGSAQALGEPRPRRDIAGRQRSRRRSRRSSVPGDVPEDPGRPLRRQRRTRRTATSITTARSRSTVGNPENDCNAACTADPECTEWSNYVTRSTFRITVSRRRTARRRPSRPTPRPPPGFDPVAMKGKPLRCVRRARMTFFSGGAQYTIEARCKDDIVVDLKQRRSSPTRCAQSTTTARRSTDFRAGFKCIQLGGGAKACRKSTRETRREGTASSRVRLPANVPRQQPAMTTRMTLLHAPSPELRSMRSHFRHLAWLAAPRQLPPARALRSRRLAPAALRRDDDGAAVNRAGHAERHGQPAAARGPPRAAPRRAPIRAFPPDRRPPSTPANGTAPDADRAVDTSGTAGARAAGTAPPASGYAASWTRASRGRSATTTSSTRPASSSRSRPTFGVGDRPQYRLFFDNLNSRFGGRENLTHLVLYKKMPAFIDHLDDRGGARPALRPRRSSRANTSNLNRALYDSGSYIRAVLPDRRRRREGGRLGRRSSRSTPIASASATSTTSRGAARTRRSTSRSSRASRAPRRARRSQYDTERFYVFGGFKTATDRPAAAGAHARAARTTSRSSASARPTTASSAAPASDPLDNLRFDVGGGYFQQGKFDLADVRGKHVYTYGGSGRIVVPPGHAGPAVGRLPPLPERSEQAAHPLQAREVRREPVRLQRERRARLAAAEPEGLRHRRRDEGSVGARRGRPGRREGGLLPLQRDRHLSRPELRRAQRPGLHPVRDAPRAARRPTPSSSARSPPTTTSRRRTSRPASAAASSSPRRSGASSPTAASPRSA